MSSAITADLGRAQRPPERRRRQPVRRRAAHAHQLRAPLQVVVDPVILRRPAGGEGRPGRAGQPFGPRREAPVGARPQQPAQTGQRRCPRSSARSARARPHPARSPEPARTAPCRARPSAAASPRQKSRAPRPPAGPERFRSQAASPRAPRQPARNQKQPDQPSRQVASAIRRRRARSPDGHKGRRRGAGRD